MTTPNSLGYFTCAACARVVHLYPTTGGANPHVVIMLVGQITMLVCEGCGRVVCSFCQPSDGVTMFMRCTECAGALELLGGGDDPLAPLRPYPDWGVYISPDRAFGVAYPADWETAQGGSKGAAFAIASPDGRALVEVIRLEFPRAGEKHAVELSADAFERVLFEETGYTNGRVLSRSDWDPGDAERAIRLVLAHRERGVDVTTDYVFRGTGTNVVYVALKCLSAQRESHRAMFEAMLGAFRAESLATGRPFRPATMPAIADAPTQGFASVTAPPPPPAPRPIVREQPAVRSASWQPATRGSNRWRWIFVLTVLAIVAIVGARSFVARQHAGTAPVSTSPAGDEEKRALVESYYGKVSAKDYPGAYALLSDAWHAYETPDAFERHYRTTDRMSAEILDYGGMSNTVHVHVVETKTDGTKVDYYGTITQVLEGTPPRWLITARNLTTHTPAPAAR
jgi:hypothetical protein